MILSLIFAAGAATASDISLTGGMSMIDGTFITAVFTGMAAVISSIGTLLWCKHRAEKVKADIPQPCEIHQTNDCISVKECNRRMKELDERVTRLETKFDRGVDKIMDKLSAMDRESEQRAVALHRRIDGISEKTSETAGAVELIKGKMFKRS